MRRQLRLHQSVLCLLLIVPCALLFTRAFFGAVRSYQEEQTGALRGSLLFHMSRQMGTLEEAAEAWSREHRPGTENRSSLVARLFPFLMENPGFEAVVFFEDGAGYYYSLENSFTRFDGPEAQRIEKSLSSSGGVVSLSQGGALWDLAPALFEPVLHVQPAGSLFLWQKPAEEGRGVAFIVRNRFFTQAVSEVLPGVADTTPVAQPGPSGFARPEEDARQWVDFLYLGQPAPAGLVLTRPAWPLLFFFTVLGGLALALAAGAFIGVRASKQYEDIFTLFVRKITGRAGDDSQAPGYKGPIIWLVARSYLASVVLPALVYALITCAVFVAAVSGIVKEGYPQRAQGVADEVDFVYETGLSLSRQNFGSDQMQFLFRDPGLKISFPDYQTLLDAFLSLKTQLPQANSMAFYSPARQNIYSSIYFDTIPFSTYHEADVARMEAAGGAYVPFLHTYNQDGGRTLYMGRAYFRADEADAHTETAGYVVFSFDLMATYAQNGLPESVARQFVLQEEGQETAGSTAAAPDFTCELPLLGQRLAFTAPSGTYWRPYLGGSDPVAFWAVWGAALGALGLLWLCFFFVWRPIRRVKRDVYGVYKAYRSRDGTEKPEDRQNEMAELVDYFDALVARMESLAHESYQDKMRLRELELLENQAQLKALQHQINPHFLYNTLEALKWMAHKHGARDIYDMVMAMSKLYRFSLIEEGDSLVTVQRELENMEEYLFIQHHRFPDKFEVYSYVDSRLLQESIPKLLLQPLVENAIEHGLRAVEEGGEIHIHIDRRDSGIHIEIADNGCGMAERQVAHILSAGSRTEKEVSVGASIGLVNIVMRVELLYGAGHVDIRPREGGGTVVVLDVPLEGPRPAAREGA